MSWLALVSGASTIVGGTPATIGEFPTTVAVVYSHGGGTSECTGVLVGPHLVLTAGNCVDPSLLGAADRAAVTAGTTIVYDSIDLGNAQMGTVVPASMTLEGAFNPGNLGVHDIGAVIVATAITGRTPSPIATAAGSVVGDTFTLVGFGSTDAAGAGGGVLRSVDKTSVACTVGSDTSLLCFSQTDGSGACFGDGGGPAFDAGGAVVGIDSFGDMNCAQFAAYTRVSDEQAFIAQAFAAAGDPPPSFGPDAGAGGDAGASGGAGAGGCCDGGGGAAGPALLAIIATLASRRRSIAG